MTAKRPWPCRTGPSSCARGATPICPSIRGALCCRRSDPHGRARDPGRIPSTRAGVMSPGGPLCATRSRPAKCPVDALVRLGRVRVARETRLVLVGLGQDRQKLVERRKVAPLHGGLDHGFHPVIARDVGWIRGTHRGPTNCPVLRLLREPFPPARGPNVIGGGIGEQAPDGLVAVRTRG